MRVIHVLVAVLILLVSCGEKIIEEPENLIPEEQMAAILYDVAILNGFKSTDPGLLKKNGIELMPLIFKKYDIDSTQFVQSDVYYASVPLKYQQIYEMVEARIEIEVDVFEKERNRIGDSIRKISNRRTDSIKSLRKTGTKDSLLRK